MCDIPSLVCIGAKEDSRQGMIWSRSAQVSGELLLFKGPPSWEQGPRMPQVHESLKLLNLVQIGCALPCHCCSRLVFNEDTDVTIIVSQETSPIEKTAAIVHKDILE